MAPLALVLLYVPCGKLAPGAFRTPPHYDGRRKRSCVLAVSVLVGEFQAAAEESHLAGLAEDPVVKYAVSVREGMSITTVVPGFRLSS